MSEWVAVVQEEEDEPIEIPTESDGTILLTSLTAQFPGVTGLKFRNPDTNVLRGVRCLDNRLYPPYDEGWGQLTFLCVFPKAALMDSKSTNNPSAFIHHNSAAGGSGIGASTSLNSQPPGVNSTTDLQLKRKSEYDTDGMSSKNIKFEAMDDTGFQSSYCDGDGTSSSATKTNDLIVLGLPWKTSENDVKEYFETFGELSMVQLKTKIGTNQSKGFAFIRFADIEVQNKVILTRHLIQNRWCDVKIPDSQELKSSKLANSCKIFVGRITDSITAEDLKRHFEAFGPVTDIYIPKPFRAFAFVSFSEVKVAQSLLGKEHLINGVSVHIGSAHSKAKDFNTDKIYRGHPPPHNFYGNYRGDRSSTRNSWTGGGGGSQASFINRNNKYYY